MKLFLIFLAVFFAFLFSVAFLVILLYKEIVDTPSKTKPNSTSIESQSKKELKPKAASSKSLESSDALIKSKAENQKTNKDIASTTNKSTVDSQEKAVPTQSQEPIKSSQESKVDFTINDQNKEASAIKKQDLTATEPTKSLQLTVVFIENESQGKSDRVKVSIPITSHSGYINEFPYIAKLENKKFSITWDTPNWFQKTYRSSIKQNIQYTHDSLIVLDISIFENRQLIELYKRVALELAFETSDKTIIPDGTNFYFFEKPHYIESHSPYTSKQIGIVYIEPGKVLEISPISIGQYYSDSFFIDSSSNSPLKKTVLLKRKILFTAVITDQKQRPLKNHFVVFYKSSHAFKHRALLSSYEANGMVDQSLSDGVLSINATGEVIGEVTSRVKHYAFLFGPYIKSGILKEIVIPNDGEKLPITVDISIAEIRFNFLQNGKLYTGELEGFYQNNLRWESFNIKSGTLLISNPQVGKLELHLKSKEFINTTVSLDVPEGGVLEKNIELKIGSTISGQLTANYKPIIGKNFSIYLYEKGKPGNDHKTQIDKNGRFKFDGLNPELTYIFHIDLANYSMDPSMSRELKVGEEERVINLIEKFDLVGLVYDETGKTVKIKNVSQTISRNGAIVYERQARIENNKFTISLEFGDKISFCIQADGFSSSHQTLVFEKIHQATPLICNLKKGIQVKGVALDVMNKPIFSGLIIEAAVFHHNQFYSNRLEVRNTERSALREGGTFQLDNVQIGEKFYVLSEGNPPIPFTIEEKHQKEVIELQAIKSYSFSGNLRSQKNVFQEGRRVIGERTESNEFVITLVDANGNFKLNCLRPGKWVFTSNFRDMYKVVPRIEIEIIDKDETYDWVVFR